MNDSDILLAAPLGDLEMVGSPSKGPLTARAEVAGLARLWIEAGWDERTFWASVHAKVQDRFSDLIRQVVEDLPGARYVAGHSDGGALILFTYVVFSRSDDDDRDPIIVGIAFSRRGSAIRITGDISGEESGHTYFDENCEGSVVQEHDVISAEALRIAELLSSRVEDVVQAIEGRQAE